ncbi:MAG: hypothetical protein AABY05_03085 [Nanoarchaeota archaeon]
MARKNIRKEIFDRLYSASSEKERELFDDPNTRKQVPILYTAWEDYQSSAKKQQKVYRGKKQETKSPEARELTCSEIMDGLEGLQIIGEALFYRSLLDNGCSKDEAMREVNRARLRI